MPDKPEDEMTLDERMEWLRERGVQVTSPEERQAATQPLSPDTPTTSITYVWIPADASQPLQEHTVAVPIDFKGDYLVNALQRDFSGGHVDTSLLQGGQTLAAGADVPAVSDATLQQVATTASVETFSLVHPTPGNQFTATHIYLDEVGMLKRLPLNPRASDYAARAGYNPPPQFYGNVALGRLQTRPHRQTVSMSLAQADPQAAWLTAAAAQNLDHQAALNQQTGRTDVRQEAVAGSEGQTATADGFTWTQTDDEVELQVGVAAETASKDVNVKFQAKQVTVKIANPAVVVQQRLFAPVDTDGCTWTIDRDQNAVVITMEKADPSLWPRIQE